MGSDWKPIPSCPRILLSNTNYLVRLHYSGTIQIYTYIHKLRPEIYKIFESLKPVTDPLICNP
jgi:hypothetical protein